MTHQAEDEAREECINMEIIVDAYDVEEDCLHEMFVLMRWQARQLGVPLMQLEGIQVDEKTQEEIEDWHYWVDQGYEL